MVEGLFAPRISARGVLRAQYGLDTAIQFAVLAYCIQAIMAILMPGVPGAQPQGAGSSIGFHFLNIFAQLAIIGMLAFAVWGIGQLFGGGGSRRQALVLVSWHALVTTLLAPLFLLGASAVGQEGDAIPLGVVLIFGVAVAQYLWVLACYTMELHGFRSPWGVMGVMLAVAVLLSTLVMSAAPGA